MAGYIYLTLLLLLRCSFGRIFRILDTEPAIPSGGIWPSSCAGRVAFSDVTFAYPTRPDVAVLQGFDLTVEPDQTVALVGTSGSGNCPAASLLAFFASIAGHGRSQ